MSHKIVAVNPLKLFPLPSFGLANVASLDDARNQIYAAARRAAIAEISTFAPGTRLERDEEVHTAHAARAEAGIVRLEERWPKIESALRAHLARQERRWAHF